MVRTSSSNMKSIQRSRNSEICGSRWQAIAKYNLITCMDFDEDKYLKALSDINSDDFEAREWLYQNFNLYKETLNWPKNRPPIGRSNLIKGTLREKFHSTYKEILDEFDYRLDNELHILELR